MESMERILENFRFSSTDEVNLKELGSLLIPHADELADEFYGYLMDIPETAVYLKTEEAVETRKKTLKEWFDSVFTARYDHRFLVRLERIGQVHVKIGLGGHYVNASMNVVRSFCFQHLERQVEDPAHCRALIETLDKALDIHLDVMTSSYREAELKKVFLSRRLEFGMVKWAERLMHGLNLLLMAGLVVLAAGVAAMLATDILSAFYETLETGVIKALGSLLILWVLIELLHTQVEHLRSGRFRVQVFVELALVAFIRKLFIAAIEDTEPVTFGLVLASLLILGVVYHMLSRTEGQSR